MRKLAVLLAIIACLGCLLADDNQSLNLTNTTISGNATIAQTANAAGGFALDKLLNLSWGDGLAAWLNSTLNTGFFTGSLIAALLPLISIGLIYWKWNSIVGFIQTAGQVILVLIAAYLVLHVLGVL
jgi:hypothetical protein